jgi:hypothetical protein
MAMHKEHPLSAATGRGQVEKGVEVPSLAIVAVPAKSNNLVSFPSRRAGPPRESIQQHAYNIAGAASTLRAAHLGRTRPDITSRELHNRRLSALAEISRSARVIIAQTEIGGWE